MDFKVFEGDKGWRTMLQAVIKEQERLHVAVLKPTFQDINILKFTPIVKSMRPTYVVEFGQYTVMVIMPEKRDQEIQLLFSRNTPDEVAEAIAYAILSKALQELHTAFYSQAK